MGIGSVAANVVGVYANTISTCDNQPSPVNPTDSPPFILKKTQDVVHTRSVSIGVDVGNLRGYDSEY